MTRRDLPVVALFVIAAFALSWALNGCGDNLPAPEPDAAIVTPPDAYEDADPCCRLLPDEDAVRQCTAPLPPNTCGVLACHNPDGTFHRVNVCGPRT